jgi:hypothetical protein
MRYAVVARERAGYSVRQLCRTPEVSVSGFHEYLSRLKRPDPDAALRADLHTIHAGSRRTYGRPRMVEEGLRGKIKGRFRSRITDSQHTQPVAENLLDRQFAVDGAVPAWVGDITYIPTREGWLYLATVIGLLTRQVFGYSLCERMPDDLVKQAFLNTASACTAEKGMLSTPIAAVSTPAESSSKRSARTVSFRA